MQLRRDSPGEACWRASTRALQQERARKREALLQASERTLKCIAARVRRGEPQEGGEGFRDRGGRAAAAVVAQDRQDRGRGASGWSLCRTHESVGGTRRWQPAQVSAAAKADTKRTPDGLPVQNLRSLLEHLGALTLNQVTLAQDDQHEFQLLAKPPPCKRRHSPCWEWIPTRLFSVNWQVDFA